MVCCDPHIPEQGESDLADVKPRLISKERVHLASLLPESFECVGEIRRIEPEQLGAGWPPAPVDKLPRSGPKKMSARYPDTKPHSAGYSPET